MFLKPDDTHLVAGMSDGTLSVRRRNTSAEEAQALASRNEAARLGNVESLIEDIGEPTYLKGGAPKLPLPTQENEITFL